MGIVDGKYGIVTGAASGIGRATAILLAHEGAGVLVTDLESQRAAGEETVALIEEAGGRARFVAGDVGARTRSIAAWWRNAYRPSAGLDFAHNNAGVEAIGSVEDATIEDWTFVLDVNLKGVWLGMKHQLAQMRSQGHGGSIVNTSSLAGVLAVPGVAAYTASKFGVVGLTKAAALEAGDAGIRVNCICPTVIRTPMIERADLGAMDALIAPQAIKRLAEPEEVAGTVAFLVSELASLVSGSAIAVDLGMAAGIANAGTATPREST